MHQQLWVGLFVLGSLLSIVGYSAAMIDWVQDYRSGVYAHHPLEAILETGALLLYTYLGIRFIHRRIRFL
ncbi:hypothetical protein [Spirosoma sp. KNUC1025]|uniref:hypothetical protein n=1 Tax=Spirosoma sp. KNUC1025 TaxID=2894082 RepID=UPI001E375EA7|nr:hypothetical protein [Spirosoma sp. KNUC1025]UFH57991.1 hypothetical protein LN737_32085 [Spirosoma sp. KNUC1025]